MQASPNRFLNSFDVAQYLVIPEAKYSETCRAQVHRAGVIFLGVFRVLPAVYFDDQHCFEANKVENVVSKGMLPAKSEAAHLPAPQTLPQAQLRVGHVIAQSAL
jgi:hypothetical protein